MNNGGPAFPKPCDECSHDASDCYQVAQEGMSLRDWFAGQALIGQVIRQELAWVAASSGPGCLVETVMARRAYDQADAMLKEAENNV